MRSTYCNGSAVLDAVSFLVAAVFVAAIPLKEVRPVRVPQHWWAGMTGGLRAGALLITLVSYHLIFAVMAVVTGAAAGYLVLALRRGGASPVAEEEDAQSLGAIPVR